MHFWPLIQPRVTDYITSQGSRFFLPIATTLGVIDERAKALKEMRYLWVVWAVYFVSWLLSLTESVILLGLWWHVAFSMYRWFSPMSWDVDFSQFENLWTIILEEPERDNPFNKLKKLWTVFVELFWYTMNGILTYATCTIACAEALVIVPQVPLVSFQMLTCLVIFGISSLYYGIGVYLAKIAPDAATLMRAGLKEHGSIWHNSKVQSVPLVDFRSALKTIPLNKANYTWLLSEFTSLVPHDVGKLILSYVSPLYIEKISVVFSHHNCLFIVWTSQGAVHWKFPDGFKQLQQIRALCTKHKWPLELPGFGKHQAAILTFFEHIGQGKLLGL